MSSARAKDKRSNAFSETRWARVAVSPYLLFQKFARLERESICDFTYYPLDNSVPWSFSSALFAHPFLPPLPPLLPLSLSFPLPSQSWALFRIYSRVCVAVGATTVFSSRSVNREFLFKRDSILEFRSPRSPVSQTI